MKKVLIIVAGVAVLAVAIWSGLWFVGRGQIEDTLDLEQARAESRGTTITWESREIGGFPFGYEMRATNVAVTQRENGMLIRIPEVISVTDASEIGRIDTRLVGDIAIDLPITEAQRAADPRLPKIARLRLTGDDLVASFSGLGQQDRRVDVTADQAVLNIDQDDLEGKVNLVVSGLNTVFKTEGAATTLGVVSDALSLNLRNAAQDGQEMTADVEIETLSVTTSLDTPQTKNLGEILFGAADGSAEIVYSAGSISARVLGGDQTGQGGGTFGYTGGPATGIVNVRRGAMDVRGESRGNVWSVEPTNPGSEIAGTITADVVQTHYSVPTGPTETPQEARLLLSVLDLDLDEALWSSVDPDGVLDRSTSELLLDIDATARVTGRLDQVLPGQVPFELSNVSLNALKLASLGGAVTASGDVEVLQPINLPMGALKVSLSNASSVLLALKQAGLIDEQMRATGAAMLQVYARPADGEDQWETDVTFGNEGISVNGLKVQ